MGCDIHDLVQIKKEGKWKTVTLEPCGAFRNYHTFGMLAGVRGDHMAEERFMEHRPKNEGNWLLHGHVHSAWKVKDKQINVGVDVWDYKPISELAIYEIINHVERK